MPQAFVTAFLALLVIAVLDVTDGDLGFAYSIAFILVCATVPMAVSRDSLFGAALLPPLLLVATLLMVATFWPGSVFVEGLPKSAGLFGRTLAAIIDHGVTMLIGFAAALATIAFRIVTRPASR